MHVGETPLPATDGWVCSFFAPGDDPGKNWDTVKMLRHLWQAARIGARILLP